MHNACVKYLRVLICFNSSRFTSLFSLVIKAGTENRYSPDTNFGCHRRFGPARAFTDNLITRPYFNVLCHRSSIQLPYLILYLLGVRWYAKKRIAIYSPRFLWRFSGFSLFWYLPQPSEQLSYRKSRILPASRGWALSMKNMVIEWKIGDIKR